MSLLLNFKKTLYSILIIRLFKSSLNIAFIINNIIILKRNAINFLIKIVKIILIIILIIITIKEKIIIIIIIITITINLKTKKIIIEKIIKLIIKNVIAKIETLSNLLIIKKKS